MYSLHFYSQYRLKPLSMYSISDWICKNIGYRNLSLINLLRTESCCEACFYVLFLFLFLFFFRLLFIYLICTKYLLNRLVTSARELNRLLPAIMLSLFSLS